MLCAFSLPRLPAALALPAALLAAGTRLPAQAQPGPAIAAAAVAVPVAADGEPAGPRAHAREEGVTGEPASPRSPKLWVVNFGTAMTLPKGKIGFAAGLGGQVVFLGTPREPSAFLTIPHAGFRYGLGDRADVGLRLAPVPLPFSSVGPGFGVNVDTKYRLTTKARRVQSSVVLGLGGAHVLIEGSSRLAYSPNAALLGTVRVTDRADFTAMARAVHLAIPTAAGGARSNFVNIVGPSFGVRRGITPAVSILPEVGAYWYDGQIRGVSKRGPGFQYGVMLATSF